jgi:hypothetical protein
MTPVLMNLSKIGDDITRKKFIYLLIEGIWGADDITQRMGNIVTLTNKFFSGPRSQQSTYKMT